MIRVKSNCIGVDISTSSVKVAEIKRGRKGLTLEYVGEEKIPVSALVGGVIRQPDNITNALQKALGKFSTKKKKHIYAVCTIPDDKVYVQEGSFPNLPNEQLKSAIEFKLQSFVPLPIDTVYWDYQVIAKNEDNTLQVLISAATKETVDSFYSVIKNLGITPISFESSATAALRAVHLQTDERILLVDMERTQTTIALVKNKAVTFLSTVHIGLNQIIRTYGEVFQVDDDKSLQLIKESGVDIKSDAIKAKIDEIFEPLKQEVQRTLSYDAKDKVKSIFLFGEGALTKGVKELLGEEIGAPIQNITFSFAKTPPLELEKTVPLLGAAERYLEKEDEKKINFLPPQAAKDYLMTVIKDTIFFTLRILSMNFAAYIVIFFLFIFFLSTALTYANQKLTSITSPATEESYTKIATTINNTNQTLQQISQTAKEGTNWIPFLQELAATVPSGIKLNAYGIVKNSKGSWDVTISGSAKDRTTLLAYLAILENSSKYLTSVTLPVSYIQNDNGITFSITAAILKVS